MGRQATPTTDFSPFILLDQQPPRRDIGAFIVGDTEYYNMSSSSKASQGQSLWAKMEKVKGELFALTYGSLVTELVRDYEDPIEVNKQLDRIGYSIGVRCVDEFLSKADFASHATQCQSLRDTAEVVAKMGFKMFLGINAEV